MVSVPCEGLALHPGMFPACCPYTQDLSDPEKDKQVQKLGGRMDGWIH